MMALTPLEVRAVAELLAVGLDQGQHCCYGWQHSGQQRLASLVT
jgi:hypothetical protein